MPIRPTLETGQMSRRTADIRRITSRLLASGLVGVTLLAPVGAIAASPVQSPERNTSPSRMLADEVLVLKSGQGFSGWSPIPVQIHLLGTVPGTVWYRWGAGPGAWQRADGALVAPEGKQMLSVILIHPTGVPGSASTVTVRSDFSSSLSNLRAATSQLEATAGATSDQALYGAGTVGVQVTVRGSAGTTVRRVGGRDRYVVASAISASSFSSADTVIVASGENFPDALTAAGLAGCLKAPMLLTQRNSLPTPIAGEINRIGAKKAIICGGPLAVSPEVEARLRALGLNVERIGGRDRYEVAANTAARIRTYTGGGGRVLVARGDLYPDALSLGPVAYSRKEPILLVLPDRMPAATREALKKGYSSAAIAGGPVSVSPTVEQSVKSIVGSTVRWGGRDRYEAAVTIAVASVASGASGWGDISIAKGTDYADALTGGIAAGNAGGILLLTQPSVLSAPTRRTLEAQMGSIGRVDVLGGPVAVSEGTYSQITSIFR